MSQQETRPVAVRADATAHRSAGYRVIYCNVSRMARSPWDLRFVFGKTVEAGRNEFVDEDSLTVITAPGHAKAFLRSLLTTIDDYEQHYGRIHDPLPALRAADKAIGDAQRAARADTDPRPNATPAADPTLRRSADYGVVYCNTSRMAKGPWDLRFVLGKTVEIARNEFAVEDDVTVIMAPGHAKAFSRALAATIETFEQTYGSISEPAPVRRDKSAGDDSDPPSADGAPGKTRPD